MQTDRRTDGISVTSRAIAYMLSRVKTMPFVFTIAILLVSDETTGEQGDPYFPLNLGCSGFCSGSEVWDRRY